MPQVDGPPLAATSRVVVESWVATTNADNRLNVASLRWRGVPISFITVWKIGSSETVPGSVMIDLKRRMFRLAVACKPFFHVIVIRLSFVGALA